VTAYDLRAQATAARTLRPIARGGKGQVVTLTPAGAPSRNPDTGKGSAPSVSGQDGSGIELAYRASEIDGTNIQRGDRKFMLSPELADGSGLIDQPVPGSTLTLGGAVLRVMAADAFKPAGNVIYTYLQLRA
jgi:hypothetical protein